MKESTDTFCSGLMAAIYASGIFAGSIYELIVDKNKLAVLGIMFSSALGYAAIYLVINAVLEYRDEKKLSNPD